MTIRNYSNNAIETELTVSVTSIETTMVVASSSGWPAAPFTILVDANTGSEEVCLVTAITGTTLTVSRGYDGSTPISHAEGAAVKHAAIAMDFRQANEAYENVGAIDGTWGGIRAL